MTDFQKKIYNDYLKALAKVNERPYKLRQNFDDFDEANKTHLYRLELFFNQFKHIEPYDFFIAYLKCRDIKHAQLQDYLKYGAIVAYGKYNKSRYDDFIDSDSSIESFITGFKNIIGFCLRNNLPTKEYRTAVNNAGVPWPLIHLNEQKISYYHLHALDISRTDLKNDYIEIMFQDFDKIFKETKQKYISSNKLKNIGIEIKNKIERN